MAFAMKIKGRIIIFSVALLTSLPTFATKEQMIASCRFSALANQHYGKLVDTKFQIFNEEKKNLNNDQIKNLLQKILNEHEDHKDTKYKELRDFYERRVRSREMDVLEAGTERMLLEAGIDQAYIAAGENLINNNLNRPVEHYYRKIFDACIR
jgi:hypothetical protein